MSTVSQCNHWEFSRVWSEEFLSGAGKCEEVRLPHTVQELPPSSSDSP